MAGPCCAPPCPIPVRDRHRLRRPPGQRRPTARPGPVTVTAGDGCFWLVIDGETVGVVPRTTTNEIHRCKAYATHPPSHAVCADGATGATVHLVHTPPGPPAAAETESGLLGALFSPAGRADPQVILRGSPLPGCQYPFAREVLRDPRFAAPSIPPSPDLAFQLLARWMIRLGGDRHRRVRDAFGGLFTARRAGRSSPSVPPP